MARKRPRGKARKGKKLRSDARVRQLARQAISAQKELKMHKDDMVNQAPNLQANSGGGWVCWQPTYISGGLPNAQSSDAIRMTNETWIRNFAGIANIQMSSLTINPVEIRVLKGYYKGSATPNATVPNAFLTGGASHLSSSFPNRMVRYDKDNWKILEDKFFTVVPLQIYDSSGSDDSVGNEPMRAVWKAVNIKTNFRLNRVYRYTDQNDSNETGDTLQVNPAYLAPGTWIPFFAIQCRCPSSQFTDYQGVNPSPTWDTKFTTYFKDNH